MHAPACLYLKPHPSLMNAFLTRRFFGNVTSRWVIFGIEHALSVLSILLTVLIVVSFQNLPITGNQMAIVVALNAVVGTVSMLANRTHHGLIRYSEARDLFTVLRFSLLYLAIWLGLLPVLSGWLGIGYGVAATILMVNTVLTALLMASFRLGVKEVYTRAMYGMHHKNNIVIYGAGDIGLATKKAIEFDKKSNCRVIAFIDDSPDKAGKILNGKRILAFEPESLEAFLLRNNVKEVILSVDIDSVRKDALSQICLRNDIHLTVIPPLSQWIKGIFNRRQLKELTIESLLGREKIELLNEESRRELEGKVVLVTGAAGSIGSDICRQLCRYRLGKIVLLDQSETGLHDMRIELSKLDLDFEVTLELASIRDKARIDQVFRKHRPHFVFHAAAYKHVPVLEDYAAEAALTNVVGTKNLADASCEHGVDKFVMISTDKAVNPTNLMGACKRIGEIYVQELASRCNTHFITTRFGNVLGSNGSVVPLFKQQIAQGGPLTVTHPDITRYFMTIPEASSLVLEAAVMGNGGEIFVFDMGQPVKILDLARKMIQLAGLTPDRDISIRFTGLRPGEKMYEELFKSTENLLPTHHPKIMKAQRSEVDASFGTLLAKLVSSALHHDDDAVVSYIRGLVPEYRSQYAIDKPILKAIAQADERSADTIPMSEAPSPVRASVNGKH
jgi:FlaA1/EpsC-like NDP-sugar epimerase